MIKKLLNNPIVVGLLALAAFGMAYRNIVYPLTHSEDEAEVQTQPQQQETKPGGQPGQAPAPTASPTQASMTAEEAPQQPGQKADYKNLGWVLKPGRDPFNMEKIVFEPVKQDVPKQMEIKIGEASEKLALKALIVDGDRKFAVIDGDLYKEGDMVDKYRIVSILSNEVVVKGPLGYEKVWIKWGKGTGSKKLSGPKWEDEDRPRDKEDVDKGSGEGEKKKDKPESVMKSLEENARMLESAAKGAAILREATK